MIERDDSRDAERLPADTAQRLLSRASELEAARGAELSVAELREAAREAGIAPAAFEQALSELRGRDPAMLAAAAPGRTRLQRMTRFWPAALVLAAFLTILLLRMILPAT